MNMNSRRSMPFPHYVLITPARNEEKHLEATIVSMVGQTVHPVKWIIVNDGSSDRTPGIIDQYAAQHAWIERLDMPSHRDRSFAAKANCFNAACERLSSLEYEVIGNVDADITFEPDYLEFLLGKFVEISDLGVAGTPLLSEGGYDSAADSFEGENYVAGPCQLFRRRCLEEIGGYVPNKAGGVDWIAVTTARMKGWKTKSFSEKRYFHHRSFGTAELSPLSAIYSYGKKDYYLGGSPIWEVFRVAYRSTKPPRVLGGAALGLGFMAAALQRMPRPVSPELMRFHRNEQMRKLKAIAATLLRFKKVNPFNVLTQDEEGSKGATGR
jgi:glycosyltransferase involved in cell wall biosynthesis